MQVEFSSVLEGHFCTLEKVAHASAFIDAGLFKYLLYLDEHHTLKWATLQP